MAGGMEEDVGFLGSDLGDKAEGRADLPRSEFFKALLAKTVSPLD